MGTSKQVNSEEKLTTKIDIETGEVLSEEFEVTTKINVSEKEPNYVKLYLDDISLLNGITANEHAILLQILKLTDYDNIVFLNKYNRENKILPFIKSKNDSVIRNCISSFVKKELLIKISTGVYKLNPFVFGRGTWQNLKALRLTIEYTNQGKTTKLEEIEEEEKEKETN